MKIEKRYDRSVLTLPGGALPYLASASAEELRILLALGAENIATTEALAAVTGASEDAVMTALRFWEKAGVLAVTSGEAEANPVAREARPERDVDARPSYTGEDVERLCADADTKELIDVCAAIFGKTFTPTEIESILYLQDGLRLGFAYIVRLCKYCYDIGKPALRYMEKVGISLYDRGVVTEGALEAYIEKEERKHDMEYRIRGLFGIGERALTPKEQAYLAAWTLDWNLSFELIELAYNEMMAAIPQPKFSYENGILKKWVDAGCRTKEDIEAFAASHKKTSGKRKKTEPAAHEPGFDLDTFFAAATLRGNESEETPPKGNG